ncbi:MAG: HalOD1 output domain-containing protein [Halobacteriota archaeon]|uniref:HalOD1 output domain-containing protein n=1 Tax=Natronomonas sp. TaxID=2184060 RepID=UPI0039760C5B
MSDEVEASPVLGGNTYAGSENTEGGGIVRAQYEWSSTDPTTAVIETVSAAADREATELEPLYDAIDPDALNALVRSEVPTDHDATVEISFRFAERRVTVHNTGEIEVRSTPARE